MIELDFGTYKKKGARPSSMALCLEFMTIWGGAENARLLRLCAAAIGVYLDHLAILPKYRPLKGNPLEYGYTILERLLESKVHPEKIYELGSICLVDMSKTIPTSKEVEDKEDFLASANSDS